MLDICKLQIESYQISQKLHAMLETWNLAQALADIPEEPRPRMNARRRLSQSENPPITTMLDPQSPDSGISSPGSS